MYIILLFYCRTSKYLNFGDCVRGPFSDFIWYTDPKVSNYFSLNKRDIIFSSWTLEYMIYLGVIRKLKGYVFQLLKDIVFHRLYNSNFLHVTFSLQINFNPGILVLKICWPIVSTPLNPIKNVFASGVLRWCITVFHLYKISTI